MGGADTAASASVLLADAHVKSITRLEQIWTGPMEVGITIQGVQSKEVTGFGEVSFGETLKFVSQTSMIAYLEPL